MYGSLKIKLRLSKKCVTLHSVYGTTKEKAHLEALDFFAFNPHVDKVDCFVVFIPEHEQLYI